MLFFWGQYRGGHNSLTMGMLIMGECWCVIAQCVSFIYTSVNMGVCYTPDRQNWLFSSGTFWVQFSISWPILPFRKKRSYMVKFSWWFHVSNTTAYTVTEILMFLIEVVIDAGKLVYFYLINFTFIVLTRRMVYFQFSQIFTNTKHTHFNLHHKC